jgi:glycosyltransferase involved in cell wall biosynthesis
MNDTLQQSLESVMQNINEQFEIIVVEDNSTDDSLKTLQYLSELNPKLRVISLVPDKNRRLGHTRNLSIREAKGEWCIFHIDTDDLIGPFIEDFVKVIEVLSTKLKQDYLFSGKQIHMARRDFLLSHGPFKNIYRGEDRDLYQRLSLTNQWIALTHERFIHRMNRQKKKLIYKTIRDSWDQMVTDMQMSPNPFKYLKDSLIRIKQIGLIRILFRFLFVIPSLFAAKRRGVFLIDDRINDNAQFVKYREANTKTLSEWQSILGINDDQLIGINRKIFY